MKNRTFIALCLTLTLSSCAAIYGLTERPQMHSEPYQCTGLDSPFPEDWHCLYEGRELTAGEQHTMNLNIQINKEYRSGIQNN